MRSTPLCSVWMACAAGLLSGAVHAQEHRGVPRVLVDRSLNARPVMLMALDNTSVTYEENGLLRTEAVAEHAAILPRLDANAPADAAPATGAAEPATVRPASFLELIDGQVFTGGLATDRAPAAESVRWRHPNLGAIEVKLDVVKRIVLPTGAAGAASDAVPADESEDVLVLANGDRLGGFLEGFEEGVVAFSVGEQRRSMPIDRVREIVLANPATPPSGMVAQLNDGTLVALRSIRTNRVGEVTVSPAASPESEATAPEAGTPATIPLADIAGVAFDASRLRPLASMTVVAQVAAADRRWTPPAQPAATARVLGATDIEIPGPMSIEWELPQGASRVAMRIDLPQVSWTWGDCNVRVTLPGSGGGVELLLAHLNVDTPTASLNAEIPSGARRLRIEVDAGAYGPVQDRVRLVRPLVSFEPR